VATGEGYRVSAGPIVTHQPIASRTRAAAAAAAAKITSCRIENILIGIFCRRVPPPTPVRFRPSSASRGREERKGRGDTCSANLQRADPSH